jgi:deoxyribodipyrimidine photo-lyase
MVNAMKSVVWLRRDLRIRDNPALTAAARRGEPTICVFIFDEDEDVRPLGGASRWWLHHSLAALGRALGSLVLLRGRTRDLLPEFVNKTGATAIFWNRCYEPWVIARDKELKSYLRNAGIDAQSFNGSLLHEPWEHTTKSGESFKVFTPFLRACLAREVAAPLPAPSLTVAHAAALGDDLNDWGLLPQRPNWAAGWERLWAPGEPAALARLRGFAEATLAKYDVTRDRPDRAGTSKLSPHLHWGEISPRQIWAALAPYSADPPTDRGSEKFRRELIWREFCYHLLYHFPELAGQNWRKEFDAYPWRASAKDLTAWQQGQTGYPFVDAGMRELWQTGWMHNRVRMVTASFLTKHLRIDWRRGEAWFWDTLLDADLANNAAGWQWVAGTGADASPYFRIFNPFTQGQKFDPDGIYVRRWCPELAKLPNEFIHKPFEATEEMLSEANLVLGESYPNPIVKHASARDAALAGLEKVRTAKLSSPR